VLEHRQRRKIRVGVLDFGDGRDYLKAPLEPVNRQFLHQLVARLESAGFDVVTGDEVIWQNHVAVRNGRRMAAEGVDAIVFNYSVWAWPQYARVAAQFCPQPIVMFSNVNPRYPGLVGMLANSGSLDQAGIPFLKSFGDVEDAAVFGRLRSHVTAVAAARRLRGLTYCLIGGRSLGIDTTVIDPAQWMKQFGIDVDHVDQFELGAAPRSSWGAGAVSPRRSSISRRRSAESTGRHRTPSFGSRAISCGGSSRCTRQPSISSRSSNTTSAASRGSAS
jgi:L-fucose isomerase